MSDDDVISFFTWDCEEVANIQRYKYGYDIIDIEVMGDTLYVLYIIENAGDQPLAQIDVRMFSERDRFRRKFMMSFDSVKSWPIMPPNKWHPEKIMLAEEYPDVAFLLLNDTMTLTNSILIFYLDHYNPDYLIHYQVMSKADAYIAGNSLFIYNYKY